MVDVINMTQMNPPLFQGDVDSQSLGSDRQVHNLRPKGQAIPGIDYGIDDVNDQGEGQKNRPPETSQSPSAVRSPGSVHGTSPSQPHYKQQHQQQQQQQQQHQQQQHQQQQHQQQQHQQQQHQQPSQVGYLLDDAHMDHSYQMPGFAPFDTQSVNSGMGIAGEGFVNPQLLGQIPMEQPVQELSYEEKRNRKIDALATLSRLENQGYVPAGKKGSQTTDLSELEGMVDKLTAQRDLDNSIKFQRKILIGFSNLMESVCEHEEYNIFELDLEGWSESVYENISEYDEVFEELYLKYKDVAKIPPEIKLISMVVGSAWMFHMSRNMFGKASSKVPGFDDVMNFDPDLKKRYQQSATNLAQQRGVPVPDKKKDKTGFGFIGQLFKGETPNNMEPPQHQPPQGQYRQQPPLPEQQREHQRQRQLQQQQEQQQQQQQRQKQRQQHARQRRPAPVEERDSPIQEAPRKTRRRIPMEEPQDVDGLLSGLTTDYRQDHDQEEMHEEEIDLSEIYNLSDLDA
jgi:hypothetical protein